MFFYEAAIWTSRYNTKIGWGNTPNDNLIGQRITPFADRISVIFDIRSVVDKAGNITLAWYVLDTEARLFTLWATHFDINKGWQTDPQGEPLAVLLGSDIEYSNSTYKKFNLVIDSFGNVTLVYIQGSSLLAQRMNAYTKIWNNQSLSGGPPIPKILYSKINQGGGLRKIMINKKGDIALYFTSNRNIYFIRYTDSIGWNSPRPRQLSRITSTKVSISADAYAIDPMENTSVAWAELSTETGTVSYSLRALQNSKLMGWPRNTDGTLKITNFYLGGSERIYDLDIVSNDSGLTAVVWLQANQIWSIESTIESGWTLDIDGAATPQTIDLVSFSSYRLGNLLFDKTGNITVVWEIRSANSPRQDSIRTTRYSVNSGWQKNSAGILTGTTISLANYDTSIWSVRSKIDSVGNIHILWAGKPIMDIISPSLPVDLYYTRYNYNSSSWQSDTSGTPISQLLENNNFGNVVDHNLAIDSQGNILATWIQSGGNLLNLYANRFDSISNSWWKDKNDQINGKIIESDDTNSILTSSYYKLSPMPIADSLDKFTIIWLQETTLTQLGLSPRCPGRIVLIRNSIEDKYLLKNLVGECCGQTNLIGPQHQACNFITPRTD